MTTPAPVWVPGSLCVHGHRFTPENTYWWRDDRYCRTCRRLRMRRYRAAARARRESIR